MPSYSLFDRPPLGDSAEYFDFVPVTSRYLRNNRELQGGSEGVCTGQGNASEAVGSVWLQGGSEGVCTGQGNASEAVGSVWLQGGCEGVRGTRVVAKKFLTYLNKKRGILLVGPDLARNNYWSCVGPHIVRLFLASTDCFDLFLAFLPEL